MEDQIYTRRDISPRHLHQSGKKKKKREREYTLIMNRNENFSFKVTSEPFALDFKVKDHNRLRSSVELGQYRCNLWDLIKPDRGQNECKQWLPLYPTGSGELYVHIQFTE